MEEKKQKKPMAFILKIFIFFILVLIIALIFVAHQAFLFLNTPANVDARAFPVEIKQGANLVEIANLLQEKNIITDANKFKILTRYKKQDTNLKAGTFLLSPAWTAPRILQELVDGNAILHKITIREGLPWWEVAQLFEKEGYCTAKDFEKVIYDKEFLKQNGIVFDNAEGFLYPDTYLLLKPAKMDLDSAKKVVARLITTFWQKTEKLWQDPKFNGEKPNSSTLKEIIILASIVERETRVEEERAKVAGVYYNRLRIKMLLQADPTIIYGLGKAFEGSILKRHLQDKKNAYNTYIYGGLPPGPICSPSLASLSATVNPAKHKFYYFVASGIGAGHVFSTNLKEHNRAVQKYRQNLRRQKNSMDTKK